MSGRKFISKCIANNTAITKKCINNSISSSSSCSSSKYSYNHRMIITNNFSTYKTTTGLVGLKVEPEGREKLLTKASEVLTLVQKIPSTSQYRINVEQWFNYVKSVATKHTDVKVIEDEIGIGQIEELLLMAQDEIELVDYYYDNKVWEMVDEAKLSADSLVAEMADSIYFTSPEKEGLIKQPPAQPAPAK